MTTKPDNRVGLVITVIGTMYVSSRGFGNWLGKKERLGGFVVEANLGNMGHVLAALQE